MSFPTEIIRVVAKVLDFTLSVSLALPLPRFPGICDGFPFDRIRNENITTKTVECLYSHLSKMDALDLSDCWSGSSTLEKRIRQCQNR